MGISAVINTYNAAPLLPEVLASLSSFDEIVVCDMESTDNTVEIATRHGARVVTYPKGDESICEVARDFAIHSASQPWVLVVDADELVTPELAECLTRLSENADAPAGVLIPRRNMFMGRYVHDLSDYQLRFMRKDLARWPAVIHSRPEIDGRIERLKGPVKACLMHLDDAPVSARLNKLNRYTDYEVPKRRKRHYGAMAMLWRPFWFFVRSYLLGGGWRDGRRGIAKAYQSAIYQMVLLSKLLEDNLSDDHKD